MFCYVYIVIILQRDVKHRTENNLYLEESNHNGHITEVRQN